MKKKLELGLSWVKRYFPRNSHFILVAIEPNKHNPTQPTISYLSTMSRQSSMNVIASVGEQLLQKEREANNG